MVRITLRKTNNFVFKTWAISRTTLCLHSTCIHRRAVQILGDQRMNLRSGVRLAALDLRKSWKSSCRQYLRRKCAEWQCRIIAPLRGQRFPVDRTSLQSWRRAPLRRLAPALAGLLPVRHTKVSLDYMARRFASGAQGSGDELAMHLAWKAIFDEAAKDALYVDGSAGLAPTLRLFESASSDIDPDDLLARMLATDTRVGLEGDMLVKADRMTMAVSLEGRVPLLDHPLVEFMARVPSRLKMKGFEKKYLLRRVMRPRLPRETLDGPKQGFNVPIPAWLLGPLREFMHDTLAPERVRAVGLFQPEVVSRLIADHENRVRDASRDIWTLLMFQSWFDGISGSAATPSGLGATPETPKFPG